MAQVRKAVVLAGGLGTRLLPWTKVVGKELLPLVDRPLLHYLLEEMSQSGIEEVVFVLSSEKSPTLDYVKENDELVERLEDEGDKKKLKNLLSIRKAGERLSFDFVVQEKPLGTGHALLQAKKKIGDEVFALLYPDDLFHSEVPALSQLIEVHKGAKRPLIGLSRVSPEEASSYGGVEKEDIAKGLYKIRGLVKRLGDDEDSTRLAVVGRFILDPFIFKFLEKIEKEKGEGSEKRISLADAIIDALEAGKTFYGSEIKGRWLKCGNKEGWLKAHLYMSLQDPRFRSSLKDFWKNV